MYQPNESFQSFDIQTSSCEVLVLEGLLGKNTDKEGKGVSTLRCFHVWITISYWKVSKAAGSSNSSIFVWQSSSHFSVMPIRYCIKALPRLWRDWVQSNSVATWKHGNSEGMDQIRWPHAPVDMTWHYAFPQYRLQVQNFLWVLFIIFWFHTELSTCWLAGDREWSCL